MYTLRYETKDERDFQLSLKGLRTFLDTLRIAKDAATIARDIDHIYTIVLCLPYTTSEFNLYQINAFLK